MTVEQGAFEIVRRLAAPPARVFRAWADPDRKRRWHTCHADWRTEVHELDLRVGGAERNRVVEPDGTVHAMEARYFDVVPDRRLVYAYAMDVGGVRISVSLAAVTFHPDGGGTRMVFAEQVTFLDGHGDLADRRRGTELGLDALEAWLGAEGA